MKSKPKTTPSKSVFRTSRSFSRGSFAPSRPTGFHGQRHDPTLGRYFQELADHAVLSSDAETVAAKEIMDLEVTRWCEVLAEPAGVPAICEALIDLLGGEPQNEAAPEMIATLETIKRRALGVKRSKRSIAAYNKLVERTSNDLYECDLKRNLIETAICAITFEGDSKRLVRSKRQRDRVAKLTARVENAKHRFIHANLRLVVAIARRYDRGQMPLIDLIQEGNLGLIKAVDRFDYRRGFRFSTYASWWIRHAIGRALADKGHAVRVPVHALDTQHRLARATEVISLKLGRTPTDEELAEEVGIDRKRLERVRKHTMAPVCSLDREISDSDDRRYMDLLSDESVPSPFESTMLRAWSTDLNEVLGILTEMEESIIRWRYGLDDGEEMTLKEIGAHYNLSRERIRQLQEQALRKIRAHLALDAA
jgi:RNA polymerase primary sigma factor